MLFHEAPHKLASTLADLAETFGPDRRICLCRELTKLHEEVVRTTLGQAVERYRSDPPKGEFVLVVEGAALSATEEHTLEDGLILVERLCREGSSTRDAVKEAASAYQLSKKALYDLVISKKNEE
jgi:16S rRNA (cytidine1402-2'-O)-methyltransferase